MPTSPFSSYSTPHSTIGVCGPSRARYLGNSLNASGVMYRARMFIDEFSSRSIFIPHFGQQYVLLCSGIGCKLPHPLHILEVLRSSRTIRSFPFFWHL